MNRIPAWHPAATGFHSRMEDNLQSAPAKPPALPANDDIARQLSGIQYSLQLSFKFLALASQANVTGCDFFGVRAT
jgi:hypothetical protein